MANRCQSARHLLRKEHRDEGNPFFVRHSAGVAVPNGRVGAIIGAVRGGVPGFAGGEILEPIGGRLPGTLLDGFLGATRGVSSGVFTGSAIAIGCSLAGAY